MTTSPGHEHHPHPSSSAPPREAGTAHGQHADTPGAAHTEQPATIAMRATASNVSRPVLDLACADRPNARVEPHDSAVV